MNIETFESDLLGDVKFNDDGSLKQSGKQNVKFYNKKFMSYKAKFKLDKNGETLLDKDENPVLDMDKRTGLPHKIAFEEFKEMVRIETRGDTTIIDDLATPLRIRQFWPQYQYFRSGKIPDGQSIDEVDFLYPSTIMELRLMGLHVVQQVALMTDLECENLRDQPGYEVRELAKQWVNINSPEGQAGKAHALALEVERLKRELADGQAQWSAKSRLQMIQNAAQEMKKAEEAEEPIRTLELTPEQLKEGKKRGK